jgi:hypothetical protein
MVIVTPAEIKKNVGTTDEPEWVGTGKHQVDFVVLTTINYCLARVGMPVVQFSETMDVSGQQQVAICGHGNIGTIEGNDGQKFADVLAHPTRGCKGTLKKLIVTSCYAGVRKNHDSAVGTAVIDIFAQTLKIKGVRIQGALGPSIKANVLGEHFRVVNAPNETSLKRARKVQKEELVKADQELAKLGKLTKHGENPLFDQTTQGNRKMSWEKIQARMEKGDQKDGKDYIEYKAAKYANLSENFFQNFETRMENEGLLLDGQNMRTVYWNGSKVVTVPPPKQGNKCCYITTATLAALGLPDDCAELTVLRRFRDEVLLTTAAGRGAVQEYYATAPGIVAAINRLPDAAAVYHRLFDQAIAPAVAAVRAGRYPEAYAIYQRLVREARARYR